MLWPSVLLVLATALPAQPPPLPPPPPPPPGCGRLLSYQDPLLDPCEQAAHRLNRVGIRVSEIYVRPVTRGELLMAALRGLYLAAERPVPEALEGRVRQALDQEEQARAWYHSSLGFLPAPLPFDLELALELEAQRGLIQCLASAFREVEGSAALKGQNELLICYRAMAGTLDAYTEVVTAEQSRRRSGYEGEGTGVGVEGEAGQDGAFVLTAVYPGSPAQRAGMRPGDRVVRVDGKAVAVSGPRALGRLQDLLAKGPLMTLDPCDAPRCGPVELTWEGSAGRGGQVTLPRTRFPIETVLGTTRTADGTWDWTLDPRDRLALVRIGSFSGGTATEVRRVLEQLVRSDCRGVVLDLRWCPGGYLNEALDVARLFLSKGLIATVSGRKGPPQEYEATGDGDAVALPLVVLVNGSTSGGAELVAAALQDHHRAVIVGQRTRGKGSVQTPLDLDPTGIGLRLTTGTFQRPSGRELHRFPDSKDDNWGVVPDVDARVSPDLGALLKRHWLWQTLRPAGSKEILPLDEPDADPQQTAAVEALRRLAQEAEVRREEGVDVK